MSFRPVSPSPRSPRLVLPQREGHERGEEYTMKEESQGTALTLNRRTLLTAAAATAGAIFAPNGLANDRDWTGTMPIRYPDPDIVVLDKRFNKYKIGNSAIQRLHTGTLWAEGTAWNAAGRYLVWSDIPNNVQMRRLDEDG